MKILCDFPPMFYLISYSGAMASPALSIITSRKCERGAEPCLATEGKVMSNVWINDVQEAMRLELMNAFSEEERRKPSSAWHGLTLEQCLSENPLVSLFRGIGNLVASLPENQERVELLSNKEAFAFFDSLSSGDKEANS